MYFCHDKSSHVHEYHAVQNTLKYGGVRKTNKGSGKWSLIWGAHPKADLLRSFHPYQKANHFPGTWQLGRKDLLWKNVGRMRRRWPQQFDIMPPGYILPDDYSLWLNARDHQKDAIWIWKPCNASCGKGIQIYTSTIPASVDKKLCQKSGVVQKYVERPLLINGFKFDLRLYVVVTSFDPLKVYLNSEGLVRLATQPYSCSEGSLGCRTMHLTNYSVNKNSTSYVRNLDGKLPQCAAEESGEEGSAASADDFDHDASESGDDEDERSPYAKRQSDTTHSSKWSLKELRDYFALKGLDFNSMMQDIKDLIVKSFVSVEPLVVNTCHQGANFSTLAEGSSLNSHPNQTCFEIYGFDVIVDSALKPWLLEVNVFPSLSSSSPFDKRVKTQLVADTLTLAGFVPFHHDLVDRAMKENTTNRLQSTKASACPRSHNLQTVSQAGSVKELGTAEWKLILDMHDEYMRRGNLDRIFPTKDSMKTYSRFFETPRYSNLVLARWLEAGGERLFLPQARNKVPSWVPEQISAIQC